MFSSIGRTVILVHDYEEALWFYREILGFSVLFDEETGDRRLLHVGLPEQPGVGLWFLEATSPEQRERVGNQTGGAPLLVLYTDDIDTAVRSLRESDVRFRVEPREEPGSRFAQFEDLYGNVIVLVQLR